MARVKSKKLLEYLLSVGVLNGTKEEIQLAKKEYRKLYCRQWKENKAPRIKEIRITYSLKEYKDIKVFTHELNMTPTAFAKELILSAISKTAMVPNYEKLEKIYQLIGLAINQNLKDHSNLNLIENMIKIEEALNQYLKNNAK